MIYIHSLGKPFEVQVIDKKATRRVGQVIKQPCVIYKRLDKEEGLTVRDLGEFNVLFHRKPKPTKLDEPTPSNPS